MPPIPPPPPPGLTAPPGYAAYHGSPMAMVALKRIHGVGRAAAILVAAAGLVSATTVVSSLTIADDAQRFLDGEIGQNDFLTAVMPFALLSVLQSVTTIAAAVLVIVWMYRIAVNHRSLHRDGTWGPGWAIGGWFAPPVLSLIPFLALREAWRASDPEVPIGGSWRNGSVTPLLTIWFVVFGPIQLVLQVGQLRSSFGDLGASEQAMAEQLTGSQLLPVATAAVDVVSAVLFVLIIGQLGARHRRLTGESER